MEQLKIEKMRQFYDIFPYPNRPFILSPKIEAQLTAHGGFAFLLAQGKTHFAEKIWDLSAKYTIENKKILKNELSPIFFEIENIFPKIKRILLIGCGTDEPLLFRKLHPQNEIIGVDLSRKAIQRARKKISFHNLVNIFIYQKKLKKVEFLLGDAEMVLHEKAIGNFDFIQCFGVLHHQPNPTSVLNAMVERLNEGGVLRLMIYSYHGRKLERRIQNRYRRVWDHFLQNRRFRIQIFFNYILLRVWQFFNFIGFFTTTSKRFRYLGPGSVTVADALMHPSDPGIPLSYIYEQATRLGLELIYCEGKIENEGYILGFENPILSWNKIVEGDKKQELLTNPIIIFRKANKVEQQ
jgi:SAM-dependent methyltransferase